MVYEQTQAADRFRRWRTATFRVAVRIAEGQNRPLADVLADSDRLARLVVDEVHFGQTHQHRLAVLHLKFGHDARTDHLRRRDAVNPFGPRPHEFDAATGDDERLEPVCTQVGKQFKLRLIDALGIESLEIADAWPW